jgi:transposase-like protein
MSDSRSSKISHFKKILEWTTMTRMSKHSYLLGSFLLFFFLGVCIFLLFQFPLFAPVRGLFESAFLPVERVLHTKSVGKMTEVDSLKQQNAQLTAQLAKDKQSEKEMAALKEQIINRIKNEGVTVVQAAKDHGISEGTIYDWIAKKVEGQPSMAENIKLKRENDQLKMLLGEITLKLSETQKKK